jgi:hypothetical protein
LPGKTRQIGKKEQQSKAIKYGEFQQLTKQVTCATMRDRSKNTNKIARL